MQYASQADLDVIASKVEHDPSNETHNARVSAVWAYAHDLAAKKVGPDNIGQFFTAQYGTQLLVALESLPFTSTCEDMLAIVRKHLGLKEEA